MRAIGSLSSPVGGRVATACAEDKNCDARPSWLFLGLSQHLEHSPCSASRFRTVSRQLQAETEIPFFYILVIVLLFFNILFHRARLRDFLISLRVSKYTD